MAKPVNESKELEIKISKIALMLEKAKIGDYVSLMSNTKRIIWVNFIGGLSRGLGMAIGFTILGALVLYVLRSVVLLNLPIIGRLISEIVKMVQEHM